MSCKNVVNNPSSGFAYIEVLDEDYNPITDCSFSATYDGNAVDDLFWYYTEYNESSFNFFCGDSDHVPGFLIGRTDYELCTYLYSQVIRSGIKAEDAISRFVITVSKKGYKAETFTLSIDPSVSYVACKSVVLKKN